MQALELAGMLFLHLALGQRSRDPGRIHRIGVGIEDDEVEVPDDDRESGEPRLVEVDCTADIVPELREQPDECVVEPHDDAGDRHDHSPPDERPVFGLLDVAEAVEARLLGCEPEVVSNHADRIGQVPAAPPEVPHEAAAPLRERHVPDVEQTGRDEDHGTHAVDDAAQLEAERIQPSQELDPARPGIAQHEPRDDQERETDEEGAVLEAFAEGHSQIEGVSGGRLGEDSPADGELTPRFLDEVESVVKEHAAHHEDDEGDVEGGDPVEQRRPLDRRGHVDLGGAEALVGAGVTARGAARLRQIGRCDARGRVRGRKDVVRAVAAGAVGDLDGAAPRREPVKAVLERLRPVPRQAPLFRQRHRGVTRRARESGDVGGRDGRAGVLRREDGVLAVAVGACGRVRIALVEAHPVDAGVVLAALGLVAPAADLLDVHLVDRRDRVESVPGVVRAVAIDAGRGPRVPPQERGAMDALLVRRDEARARRHLLPHDLVLHVAGHAQAFLGELARGEVRDGSGGQRFAVAGQTGQRPRPGRPRTAVLGREEPLGDVGMAVPAGGDVAGGREVEARVSDLPDGVRAVTVGASGLDRLRIRGGQARVEGVGFGRRVVAGGAIDGSKLRGVWKIRGLREVRMAVHAREARFSVHGPRERLRSDEDRAPVVALGRGIAVAGLAVLVRRRGRIFRRGERGRRGTQRQSAREDAKRSHAVPGCSPSVR